MTDPLAAAVQAGVAALRAGDGGRARTLLMQVERAGRATPQLRVLIARASLIAGDREAADAIVTRVLAEDPGNLSALILRGDLMRDAGDDRAASGWYQAALSHAPRLGTLPSEVMAELRRAEEELARGAARFRAHLDTALAAGGDRAAAAGPRFAEALAILAGEAEVQLQRPTSFYYPGLPQTAWFDPADFPWVGRIEAAADDIRAELAGILADDLPAYVTPEPGRPAKRHALLGDPRWGAYHLYRGGAPVADAVARCPATLAALEAAPLPRIAGRSPMALFSVLRGGTHIPPHHGLLNTRLICHLPLVVPAPAGGAGQSPCRLRVGNVTRPVVRDRVMIFDDSMEHEAWNDSAETRVVLLFEIWRPELSAAERDALTVLYQAIGRYGDGAEDQGGA